MADKKQTWGSRHGDLSNEGLSLLENAAYTNMIIAALVDRIEIGENYEVHIQFKVSAEQFIRQTA